MGPPDTGTRAGDSELSIIHYLQVLYRRRHVALAAFLMVFLGASLYTFTAVRIYESTVRILIERENPKVVSFQEVLDPGEITDDYYETQYRILQSRVLARRTIDALNLWSDPQFNQPPRMTIRRPRDDARQHGRAVVRAAAGRRDRRLPPKHGHSLG